MLRGPAALLYGSSAIGGVVNVIDSRIPRSVPKDGISGDVLLAYGSVANERSANAQVNAALGGRLVAHVDAAYTKYDDLRIGGHVLSSALRTEAAASPDPASPRGRHAASGPVTQREASGKRRRR